MEKLLTSHQLAKLLNVWLETLRESDEEKSAQEELVEDMIAIVTSFSARLYGKRGGRLAKKLTELIKLEVAVSENYS